MTRSATSIDVSSFTTDAKFRTWGGAISTAMQASGLVKTSDTGQIDFTTVAKPTTTSTAAGYEIYRFSDSLQSTYPIYLKLEYGSSATTSGNAPNTWLTVGTGTDGAGNITGVNTTRLLSTATTSTTSTNATFSIATTHTAGYWCLLQDFSATATPASTLPGLWIIERQRSQTDGTPTGPGFTVGYWTYVSGVVSSQFRTTNVDPTKGMVIASVGAIAPTTNASSFSSKLFPFYHNYPGPYQGIGAVGCGRTDIADKATFTCKPIGAANTHTYIYWASGSAATRGGTLGDANSNVGVAYLWED